MYPNSQTQNYPGQSRGPWPVNTSSSNLYPNQPPPPYTTTTNPLTNSQGTASWPPQPVTGGTTANRVSAPPTTTTTPIQRATASQSSSSLVKTEVKLYSNNREREHYDNMADLFSIVKTIEALEKAYIRNAINGDEYKKNCYKLLTQLKAAQNLTRDTYPNINQFMTDYRIDNCKAAKTRIEEGLPMLEASAGHGKEGVGMARLVAETVQFFITAMDSLKLNMTAVDQIHPLLTDLYESLCRIPTLSQEWEGKLKIKNWLVQMNKMKASDDLNEEQIRQMLFDLESSYNAFHKSLAG